MPAKHTKKRKSGLKNWHIALIAVTLPLAVLIGGLAGEILRGHSPNAPHAVAQTQIGPILQVKHYFIPVKRKQLLRIEPYLELGPSASLNKVCYYMPRIEAAAFGVVSPYLQTRNAESFDKKKLVQAIQRKIKDSHLEDQVARVHVTVAKHDLYKSPRQQLSTLAAQGAVACKKSRVAATRSDTAPDSVPNSMPNSMNVSG